MTTQGTKTSCGGYTDGTWNWTWSSSFEINQVNRKITTAVVINTLLLSSRYELLMLWSAVIG